MTATGVIWSRYSMVITPKNWNLFAVNVFMAGTGIVQLYRKFSYVVVCLLSALPVIITNNVSACSSCNSYVPPAAIEAEKE